MNNLVDLAENFLGKKEAEIREQICWLIDRGILVIHETEKQVSLNPEGERYNLTVSQRLGVSVETERYINKLEAENRALKEIAEAAKNYVFYTKVDCPACQLEDPVEGVPCYCNDFYEAFDSLRKVVSDFFAADLTGMNAYNSPKKSR